MRRVVNVANCVLKVKDSLLLDPAMAVKDYSLLRTNVKLSLDTDYNKVWDLWNLIVSLQSIVLSPIASDHRSLTSCAKTRSSEKFFIEARETFRKRSEDNYFNIVAQFNNSLSQLNILNIHHKKVYVSFEEKWKIFWKGKQWKDSNKKVTLQDGKFSRSFNYWNFILPQSGYYQVSCNYVWSNFFFWKS